MVKWEEKSQLVLWKFVSHFFPPSISLVHNSFLQWGQSLGRRRGKKSSPAICQIFYTVLPEKMCQLQHKMFRFQNKKGFSHVSDRFFCKNFLIFLHLTYLIFVIFFTRTKFLENKIYTEKTRKLRQNTQKIANFLRYYGKTHSKLPIFRVKSVRMYTGQQNLHDKSRGFRDKYQVWN